MTTLAVKYRPHDWASVIEQGSTKVILQQQLETGEIKNAYLFCGPAGCGKTTCARIFANDINHGQGNPIELDAASNNGVEDIRNISQQAKTKSLNSEYKCFIIDECHSISNQGWQAMLKLIEEPPAKSIFIFCTTDPQKIPKTILSRVQRYDFKRISQEGIVDRLKYILTAESIMNPCYTEENDNIVEALEYIAKIADGGMRDSISLMDKCLSYNSDLTLENVVKALGTVDYDVMLTLTDRILNHNPSDMIETIESLFNEGKDLKTFLKQYIQFVLDISKFGIGCDWKYITLPRLDNYETWLNSLDDEDFTECSELLEMLIKLNADIKYSNTVKSDIEASLFVFVKGK